MKNRRGGIYAFTTGIGLIAFGIVLYIVLSAVFLGSGGGTGLFDMAEDVNQLNISNESTYQTVKNTWAFVPIALILAGFITIVLGTQQTQPQPYYQPTYIFKSVLCGAW